jgi:hypothetical protein
MLIIPAVQEEEIEKITVQGQPRKIVHKTPSQPIKSWTWWLVSAIPALWEP